MEKYWVSEDGKELLWLTYEDSILYVRDTSMERDKIKLDSHVVDVDSYSDDMKVIVYRKEDDSLYLMRNLREKEKVSADVNYFSVSDINGKFTIVYTKVKSGSAQYTVMDFIEDDLAVSDSAMKKPQIEEYQSQEQTQSFWGKRTDTVTQDEYYEELDKYRDKEKRDQWRERMKKTPIDLDGSYVNADIYLYRGKAGKIPRFWRISLCSARMTVCKSYPAKTTVMWEFADI